MSAPGNQLIKDTAALKQKKFRDESGLILVEGKHPIEEAVRAGLIMKQAFVRPDQPGAMPAIKWPVTPFEVDEKVLERLSSTTSAPPCLATFETPPSVSVLTPGLILVLDGIQDPGNLGTLARSAVAFGVDSLVLTGDHVEPFNPKVIRASAGLIFALPVLEAAPAALDALLAGDWRIYVTTGQPDAISYREADYSGRCAIVLGNEGRGVSADLLANRSVVALTIPMAERVESLNVAVSGSVILAEAAARRLREVRV